MKDALSITGGNTPEHDCLEFSEQNTGDLMTVFASSMKI